MTLKDRLLAALDTSLDDVSEEILVDIILEQFKKAKSDVVDVRRALCDRDMHVAKLLEDIKEIHNRLRSDPTFGAHGDFYFQDVGTDIIFILSVAGPNKFTMFKRQGTVDFVLQQLPPGTVIRRSNEHVQFTKQEK